MMVTSNGRHNIENKRWKRKLRRRESFFFSFFYIRFIAFFLWLFHRDFDKGSKYVYRIILKIWNFQKILVLFVKKKFFYWDRNPLITVVGTEKWCKCGNQYSLVTVSPQQFVFTFYAEQTMQEHNWPFERI